MKQLIIMALILTATLVGGVSRVQAAPPPDPWGIIVNEAVRENCDMAEKVPAEQRPAAEYGGPPMGIDSERHFAGEMYGLPGMPFEERRFMGGHSGPATWARHEGCLPCLVKALGLSDAQKKQIAAIARDERDKAFPLLKKGDEIRSQLRRAERAATFDEKAVRAMADNLARLETGLIVSRAKAHNRIAAVLTPAQRAIMEKMEPETECRPGPPSAGMERK
jgi:Spy/CpxP family protein refolding chaperone